MKKQNHEGELNLQKLYKTISNYKWLILSLMIIFSLLMTINLYFKPSVYHSSAIIEINSKNKPSMPNDFLINALAFSSASNIEKEMEIFKTFSLNNNALQEVDFRTKIFIEQNYRDIEVYENQPIELKNIKILNSHIIGKEITLTPYGDDFTLTIENSFIDKIINYITSFNKDITKEKFTFNEEIQHPYFQLKLNKLYSFNKSIKFILCGDNRRIYYDTIMHDLKVQQLGQNVPLIKISFEDTIPKRAEDYINALASSFIHTNIRNKNEQNNKVLTFLNQQLNDIRQTLEISEENLEQYKTKNKIIEPSVQASTYIKKLSSIEIELSDNLLKQKLVSNLLVFARNNNNLDSIAPSLMELNDKPTLQLISSLQSLEIEEKNLKTELTSSHPKVISNQQKTYNIREKIVSNIKNLKILFEQKKKSLKIEKQSYVAKIQKLPNKEKNLVNIKRDYQVSSTMYNYLLKKKAESELLIVSTLSDARTLDKAYTLSKPIKPKKTLIIIAASLIGLILGLIIALILEALNTKIKSKEELEELTNLPLLGVIPVVKKKEIKLEIYENPSSHFTESYRSLRANLPQKRNEEDAKTIVITSTVANEGKTTLTLNLASIFQMADYKCIIINLDLRKPTLHKYFNLQNEKGISSYLKGDDSIQDIVFASKYTNLHIITSGPIPDNPSELILSNRFTELLSILKTRYDYIFIDTAPIGLVSDSIHLMKQADQNLLVVREDYSEESFISTLNDIVNKHKLNNMGLVLNRSKSKKDSYGYGYGY